MTTRAVRFGTLTIEYDEQVLEPRPWTLAQAQRAAELAATCGDGPLLELCCGAGQIGLAAAALSRRHAVLVDASEPACRFATRNADAAGLADLVEVRQAPMDQALAPAERFALVLADPPYIPTTDTGTFPRDPLTAIDGGADGLDLARLCLRVGADHLRPGGPLLLQLRDPEQADLLAAELKDQPAAPLSVVDALTVRDGGCVLHLARTDVPG
jgi:methylase of polypeptide subunit release factors